MDNYFTSFRLLTHLGINNIRATRLPNKNRLRKCFIIRDKQLQQKERGHFEIALIKQKTRNFRSFYREIFVASTESCKPKRFVRCWNKVDRKYIQEQQPN